MQSAYHRRHSTETAIIKVQNDIFLPMDNGNVTMLLLHLSAAFDNVSSLINRLEKKSRNKRKRLRLVQIMSIKQTTMPKNK